MPDIDFDDDDTTQDDTSTNFTQLRAHARKLERDLKRFQEQNAELLTFKAEAEKTQRRGTATSVFSEIGLGEKQAQAFLAMNPEAEISRDTAVQWAKDLGFAVVGAEPEEEVEEVVSFRPVSVGGVAPSTKRLTYEQYRAMLASNPSAAMQAVSEGRVDGIQSTPRQ